MRRKSFTIVAAAACAMAAFSFGTAQAAQLLAGFEGNLNNGLSTGTPFVLQNGVAVLNGPSNPVQYTATGATQGATSARFSVPLNSFTDGLQLTESGGVTALRDAYNTNTRFAVDVTIPAVAGQPAGAFPYVVLSYYINSDGTGGSFRRSSNLKILSGPAAGNDNAYNQGTVTMYFDYAAALPPLLYPADSAGPVGFTQFGFTFNDGNFATGTGPLVAYLDNFRFVSVPEPVSIAALAAPALMLRRVRRGVAARD